MSRTRTLRSLTAIFALAALPSCRLAVSPSAVGSLELTATDLGPMVPARVVRVLVGGIL